MQRRKQFLIRNAALLFCFGCGTVFGEPAYRILHSFGATSKAKVPTSTLVEDGAGTLFGAATAGGANGQGTLFRLQRDGTGFIDIYDFLVSTASYLHYGSDGRLYVTTSSDGTNGFGTIFHINTDGSGFQILHQFGGTASDGKNPVSPVIEADGYLWGTTAAGGTNWSAGTIYKLAMDGSGYQVVWTFAGNSTSPWAPRGAVLDGGDGWLYGTTQSGGAGFGWGTAYRVAKDGSSLQLLHSFTSNVGTGAGMPIGALIPDDSGMLWGVTDSAVFRLSRNGSSFQFTGCFMSLANAGYGPRGGLVRGTDGSFYGLTQYGGSYTQGTLYRVNPTTLAVTWLLSFGSSERAPNRELLASTDGYLYGTTSENFLGGPNRVFRYDIYAGQKTTMAEFGLSGQMASPRGGVIEGANGRLLGVATVGGGNSAGGVYSVDPTNGDYQELVPLASNNGGPFLSYAPLFMGADGYIYATSASGGSGGNGTVFQIEPSGAWLQMLYNFSSPLTDGRILYCALTQGADGYLYGTTAAGGTTANGTLFRLATYGSDFSVLHQFGVSAQDGNHPRSGVLADADGWFYGTTEQGGTAGTGTVYRAQANGNYQVLHHFLGAPVDGARPYAELVRAADGFLYGTCREGGPTGDGVIFRLNSDGSSYAVIHAFDNSRKEGRYPQSRLILAGTEGLYGVTTAGGIASTGGTLFRVGLDGSYFTVLHTFGVDTGDGVEPNALTLAQDGALLGATRIGGNWSKGTVFRVLPLSIEPLAARVVAAFGVGQMNLEIHGRPKTTYWVEATTDLARGPWTSIGTPVATSTLGVAQVRDSQPLSAKYYRVVTAAAP